ncbi:LPS export ABC transporter periplasmic protein LptC [Desulfovibrio sp. OttesenSCG-928-A18]|nr:LPS export ABC transporter periplasmic protein LptC [Desulfovibrio sp. OttesenSCG-928-A18]
MLNRVRASGGAAALLLLWLLFSLPFFAGPCCRAALAAPPPASGENPPTAQDGALNLALRSISLSQGEGGFEIWRLKAEWANMFRADGRIVVEKPYLTYFLRDEGKVMYISAEKGDIEQKEQILRFIDQVRITRDDTLVTGSLLVYDGREKTMTFPRGGSIQGKRMAGDAAFIVWDIKNDRLEASGEVNVLFSPPSDGEVSTPKEDNTP